MPQLIAGIYEIEKQIGAGGGGIVYLGQHTRLKKQVVLKADRRTLNASSEALRREVDMLKGLSHTYIPQVYDFVQENGAVYTVMDYIEGVSLDKVLKNGRPIAQPDIVRWAGQLLEALCYLHSRPPYGILHGDIKPANIMLRPNGDICLIDFNIALALGEEGAVKVGRSRGYASPEHYGIEYSGGRPTPRLQLSELFGKNHSLAPIEKTEVLPELEKEKTAILNESLEEAGGKAPEVPQQALQKEQKTGKPQSESTGSTSSRKTIMLDVRSDIYSLGATLYHLLSGHRPDPDAREVAALGPEICSPAVAAIIQKAMAPAPDLRYQAAEEMLTAFRELHKRDKRSVRHRRHILEASVILTTVFFAGGASTFVGLRQMKQRQTALTLAEYSADARKKGDISEAVKLAMEAIPKGSILDAGLTAEAQNALTAALGVYELSDGFQSMDAIRLPSAPFKLILSPKGTYVAAVYSQNLGIFETETAEKTDTLPTQNSALSDVIFIDDTTILYAGDQGVTKYDIKNKKVLWTVEPATTLALSGDGLTVAAVNREEDHAVIYRVADGSKISTCSFHGMHQPVPANDTFADPNDNIFALNEDGTLLAASFSGGELSVFDLQDPDGELILFDESDYTHFEGGFAGKYFALAADKSEESLFGLIDTDAAEYLGGYDSKDNFLIRTDEKKVFLANGNLLVHYDPETQKETELAYVDNQRITGFSIGENYILVTGDDNSFSFYDSGAHKTLSEICSESSDFAELAGDYAVIGNRSETAVRLFRLEDHEEAELLSYDARFAHDEARISADEKTAMLFNYQQFRIYDRNGTQVAEGTFPDSEQIYDQQFRKEGEDSWLEVIWYDGTVRTYNADDGSLREETKQEAPSKDLCEEFYTDQYRIKSVLHGAPEVYDRKTDKLITTLEKDAYLTYVTQVGSEIITEYVSAAGERYGLLLDDKFQTLAKLPNLCDVSGNKLIFDYQSGNLRESRLYSIEELKKLGEQFINSSK